MSKLFKFLVLILLFQTSAISARILPILGASGFGYASYKVLKFLYDEKYFQHPNQRASAANPSGLANAVPDIVGTPLFAITGTLTLICLKSAITGRYYTIELKYVQ